MRGITIFLLSLASSAIFSSAFPPVPLIHDEFAQLLGAETLLQSRFTNPTPLHPEHFESFTILVEPSYVSCHFPAQAFTLAMGKALFGSPIVGVWLFLALACAALFWCFRGWVNEKLAFIGALVVSIHPELQGVWGSSFWRGGVTLLGAALLWGALPRVVREPERWDYILAGVGVVLLMLSRPFESLAICVSALCYLAYQHLMRGSVPWKFYGLNFAPLFLGGVLFLGFYNHQVTGRWYQSPYAEYIDQYFQHPPFLFGGKKIASRGSEAEEVTRFHRDYHKRIYEERASFVGYARGVLIKLKKNGLFFIGISMSFLLIGLYFRRREFPVLFQLSALFAFLLWDGFYPYDHSHHFAPIAPVIFLLLLFGVGGIKQALPKKTFAIMMAIVVVGFMGEHLARAISFQKTKSLHQLQKRPELIAHLEKLGGKHLIFVRYSEDRKVFAEWVYNGPSLKDVQVIWARDLGSSKNTELLGAYANRSAWVLEPDRGTISLKRYRMSGGK